MKQSEIYFIVIRIGFTIGMLITWLENGKKESLEEMLEIMKEQLVVLADVINYKRALHQGGAEGIGR